MGASMAIILEEALAMLESVYPVMIYFGLVAWTVIQFK